MTLPPPLSPGAAVKFVGGSYKGKRGVVEKLTPQRAYISSPEIATSPVLVNQTSVQALAEEVAGLKLEERPRATDRTQEERAASPAPQTPREREGSDSRRNPMRAARQLPLSLERPSSARVAARGMAGATMAAKSAEPGSAADRRSGGERPSLEQPPSPMQLPSAPGAELGLGLGLGLG